MTWLKASAWGTANVLRRASVPERNAVRRTAAGRRWLRAYLNGCAYKVFDAVLPPSLAGLRFSTACEWLARTHGTVLIGELQLCTR